MTSTVRDTPAGTDKSVLPGGSASAPAAISVRWRKPRRWWAALAAALLALAAAAAYRMLMPAPAVAYVTAPVTRGAVTRIVSASGTVNPQLTIIVGSYVSGVIQELFCDYNTEVKKGQICARIDPRPYQTVVDQNQAELATAQAQLAKDQAGLAYAEATYGRTLGLVKDGFVSRDAVDSAANARAQARAQVGVDQAAIRQRQAALKAALVNLGYTDIVSPVDGTVVSRNVTIGQTVAASFQTPTLFLIATDLTRMQVDTNVSESDIGNLKVGNPASFTVEAFPTRSFQGVVSQVRQAPQTVQNVVTYDVIVGTDNAELLLKPGMTATMRIVTERRDDVLRVPDQALRFAPAGAAAAAPATAHSGRAWLLRDGRPQPVDLVLGLDDDSFSEVVQGPLKAGDAVILGEQRADGKQSSAPLRFGL